MKAAFAMFGAVMLMGIAGAAGAQEGDLAALRAENAALRAELAMLRDGGGQCAPAGGGEGGDVALLLRKLSVLADQAALGLIAPPDAALRIPDAVLSAYVPGQFIFVLSPQAPDLPGDPEAIAAAYGLAPGSVRYVYGRVFRGFAAFASEPDRARLSADPRLQSVARDGYVFMAQTLPGFGGATANPPALRPTRPSIPGWMSMSLTAVSAPVIARSKAGWPPGSPVSRTASGPRIATATAPMSRPALAGASWARPTRRG